MQAKLEGENERERRIEYCTISRLDIDSREHESECVCSMSKGKWRLWMVGNKYTYHFMAIRYGFLELSPHSG